MITGITDPAEAWAHLNGQNGDRKRIILTAMNILTMLDMPQRLPV